MRFRVLGPVEFTDDSGRLIRLGSAAQRTILSCLLIRANKVVTMDHLAEALWGQTPPPSARESLRVQLHRIRRNAGIGERLSRQPTGLLLTVDTSELDSAEFETLAAQGHEALASGATTDAARTLRASLSLWRGDSYENVAGGEVVRAEAQRLSDLRLAATEDCHEAELAVGTNPALVAELRNAVQAHPLRERLRGQLMRALCQTGCQAEAIATYEQARRRLADELGVDPSTHLRQLHLAILRGEQVTELLLVRPQAPRRAGRAPGERDDTRHDRPSQAPPAQLPAAPSSFVGRASQLRSLDDLVTGSDSPGGGPIVSIVGPAGIGKTALALRWAHAARDRYPDGQLYADLRGFSPGAPAEPVHVLAGFVRAMGGSDHLPADVDEVAARYRTLLAGRRVLVLLDNASSARQVRPLLPASTGSLVLVTSRDSLGGLTARDGACRIGLSVFNVDESLELLARMLGGEPVVTDRRLYTQLAQLCGHLPLALRIAAAHLAYQEGATLGRYLWRLRADRFAALSVPGDEDAAVRATFDWSYTAQPQPVQRAFRLIGLLPGSDLTAPACAQLADVAAEQAESWLERLAGAHLLERRAPGRYGCHDLLKEYARHRVDAVETPGERAAALERLMRWYAARTEDALRALAAGQEAQARPWLEAERPNLVAAVQWSQVDGPRELGRRLTESMTSYLMINRHLADGRAVGEAVLTGATTADDPKGVATGLLSLASAATFGGDYAKGILYARDAYEHSGRAGWVDGQIEALSAQGHAYIDLGDANEASLYFHRIIALVRASRSRHQRALPLGGLGSIHYYLGQPRVAIDYLDRALALERAAGDLVSQARTLDYLGGAHHQLGHLDEARRLNTAALDLAQRFGRTGVHIGTLTVLAEVAIDLGDPIHGYELAQQALRLARQATDHYAQACAHNSVALALAGQGRHEDAIVEFTAALAAARHVNGAHPATAALVGRALSRAILGETDTALTEAALTDAALTDAEDGQRAARDFGFLLLEGQGLHALAVAHLSGGQPELASGALLDAMRIHREHGHRLHLARAARTARRIPTLTPA